MPLKHYHLKCGPSLLALLDERWTGFCPICEMEKIYHDPKTSPKLKVRLRRDIDAYRVHHTEVQTFIKRSKRSTCCKLLKKQRESSICQKVKD